MSATSGWKLAKGFIQSKVNSRAQDYEQGPARPDSRQGDHRNKLQRNPSRHNGSKSNHNEQERHSSQANGITRESDQAAPRQRTQENGLQELDRGGQQTLDSYGLQTRPSVVNGSTSEPVREEHRNEERAMDSRQRPQLEKENGSSRAVDGLSRRNSRSVHDEGYPRSAEEARRMIRELRSQVRLQEDRLAEAIQNYTHASKKNVTLAGKNDNLKEEIRQFQQRSFRSMPDARWMPLDASTVTGELNKIRDAIGQLAKSYAADNFFDLVEEPSEMQTMFCLPLKSYFRFESDRPLSDFLLMKHAPRLALTAMISGHVHWNILERPFFFIDQDVYGRHTQIGPRNAPHHNHVNVLDSVYRTACNYDQVRANVWRSDTLRLLHPIDLANEEAGAVQLSDAGKLIDEASHDSAILLASKLSHWLFRRMEDGHNRIPEQFERELAQLFIDAGRLSVRLWSQRPSLQFVYLPDLANEPFNVSSGLLQAHGLHKLDHDDRRLDGYLPKIVVHPAILAVGTHDADDYDQQKVLVPAVVCLDEHKP